MRYKYIITNVIRKRLEKENLNTEIWDKLNKILSLDTEIKLSQLSGKLYLYKSSISGAPRFAWFKEIQGENCIYVLRWIFRKHDDYERELNDNTKHFWENNHQIERSERKEIDALFKSFNPQIRKEALPEEYRKYEGKRAFDKYSDSIYYEMPLWTEGIKRISKEFWQSIQEVLSVRINDTSDPLNHSWDVFDYYSTAKYTIIYRRGSQNGDIYLLDIVSGNKPNFDELIDREYDCEKVEDLRNFSSKCYPDYYTYDYDTWRDIEVDDTANLALSEEEVRILQTVEFPFFVSGLAGSGKSTVLYYLYANVYKYVAKEHPDHKMLFLSYNSSLVDKARHVVKSILSYHSSNEGFKDYFTIEKNLSQFERSFVPFRDFLKTSFLDETNRSKFSEEKHITFERFSDMYSKARLANKSLSASILWSVIRTFIKGRSMEYFTPEKYISDEIVRNDRTVDPRVYREAYSIWDTWYRHLYEKGEYWDDLDLVREVLSKKDAHSKFHSYSVIFCDEAQDFTKLEIDLILKLSIHSKYKLLHPDDKRIPIAFAGDPNQTINPTGFRWAGTKAIFNESFEDSLGTEYPKLDPRELSINYRSQLGIVKFANTIQSIRYNYFDETSRTRKLQSVREDLKGENMDALKYVGFYSYDEHKDVILENLKNANIITSGEGEEGDISLFPEINNDNVKLYTAMGTKGLEYKAVMLFNFCNDPAFKISRKILTDEPLNDSERFEAAHFFTKLYIAVSRAREQLFIVDTTENYNNFWVYFTEHELWEKLIGRFIHDSEKRKLVGHVTMGEIDSLPERLSETYNPEENGRQAFEKAKGEQSANLMRRAQNYFLEAKLTASADECDAYIFLYEFEYMKAGDKFKDQNKISEAINAYWKGACWEKLLILLSDITNRDGYDNIRLITSKFMIGVLSAQEYISYLVESEDSIDQFQDAIVSHLDDRSLWVTVLSKVKANLEKIPAVSITISLLGNMDIVSKYIVWYESGLAGLRARLYYDRAEFNNSGVVGKIRTDDYKKAIDLWESLSDTGHQKYYKAKKLIATSDSDRIIWMEKLREQDEIINKYADINPAELTDEAASAVFSSLLQKDYQKAITYSYPKDINVKWERLYSRDRVSFLKHVVLNKFTLEKFYFIADKAKLEEVSLFDDKLSVEVFNSIFSLKECDEKGRPYWTYFTSSLKNQYGDRILKSNENRLTILDTLSKILSSPQNQNMILSSCFLEFVFDSAYNCDRTNKYSKAVLSIFNQDYFFKDDFSKNVGRNKYFTQYCEMSAEELDTIKNNIRNYAKYYVESVRKFSAVIADNVKTLLRAYEICAPYQDYMAICKAYANTMKIKALAPLGGWLERRLLFNKFIDDYKLNKEAYAILKASFKKKHYSIDDLIDDFRREDASMFVAILGTAEGDLHTEDTLRIAKLIYKHRIRRENLRSLCSIDLFVVHISTAIDLAIDETLAKERINEYRIKLLSYVWESIYDYGTAANNYDKLINRNRLSSVTFLRDYLKKRALLHYSHLTEELYNSKQNEYGIILSKDALPSIRPKIEERKQTTPSQPKDENKPKEGTGARSSSRRTKKENEIKGEIDLVKAKEIQIVENAKRMGLPYEQISILTGLTIEEIRNL